MLQFRGNVISAEALPIVGWTTLQMLIDLTAPVDTPRR